MVLESPWWYIAKMGRDWTFKRARSGRETSGAVRVLGDYEVVCFRYAFKNFFVLMHMIFFGPGAYQFRGS